MEYKDLAEIPHYTDCEPIVRGLGYALVELRVFRTNGTVQVRAVIAHADTTDVSGIGVNDCAKVHRVLLPRLEALLQSPDIYMEVTSPGTERLIKNAAEFVFFKDKYVKVYDTAQSDWVSGKIVALTANELTLDINGTERGFPLEKIAKAKLLNV